MTTSEHAEICKLKRENAELRRAKEILKSAPAFWPRSSTAPQRNARQHRCSSRSVRGRAHLARAAGSYPGIPYLARVSGRADRPPSDREIRDEQLIADLRKVHRKNYSVYGVKKMHRAMRREGWNVGREQTRRLTRKAGLRGVLRGKPVFTTITDPTVAQPAEPGVVHSRSRRTGLAIRSGAPNLLSDPTSRPYVALRFDLPFVQDDFPVGRVRRACFKNTVMW
jgi:hypothetical protein